MASKYESTYRVCDRCENRLLFNGTCEPKVMFLLCLVFPTYVTKYGTLMLIDMRVLENL